MAKYEVKIGGKDIVDETEEIDAEDLGYGAEWLTLQKTGADGLMDVVAAFATQHVISVIRRDP